MNEESKVPKPQREIYMAAIRLFEGNLAEAVLWLATPRLVFDIKSPNELAKTEEGAKRVLQLKAQIEQGVFT